MGEEGAKECLLKKEMSACLCSTYHVQEEKAWSLPSRHLLSSWEDTSGHKSHYKAMCIEVLFVCLRWDSFWQFSDENQHAAVWTELHPEHLLHHGGLNNCGR